MNAVAIPINQATLKEQTISVKNENQIIITKSKHMTETVNGLHSCKPGNDPIAGQVKTFTIEHRTSKTGKPWLKIKSASADQGGQPYRIVSAKKTDFVDNHGNVSYNVEIEKSVNGGDEHGIEEIPESGGGSTYRKVGGIHNSGSATNGIQEARQHLCQAANLYNLCVKAVDAVIAPELPEVARTSEQFQATLASLFIEASSRRTTDGVNWWSYVDKMPTRPLPVHNGNEKVERQMEYQENIADDERESDQPPF